MRNWLLLIVIIASLSGASFSAVPEDHRKVLPKIQSLLQSSKISWAIRRPESFSNPEKYLEKMNVGLHLKFPIQNFSKEMEAPPGHQPTSGAVRGDSRASQGIDESSGGIDSRSGGAIEAFGDKTPPKVDALGSDVATGDKLNAGVESQRSTPISESATNFNEFKALSSHKTQAHERYFVKQYQNLVNVLLADGQDLETFAKTFYKNHTLDERLLLYLVVSQNFDEASPCISRCNALMLRDKRDNQSRFDWFPVTISEYNSKFIELANNRDYETMLSLSWTLGFYSYMRLTVESFLNRDRIAIRIVIELHQLVMSFTCPRTYTDTALWDSLVLLISKAYSIDSNGKQVSAFDSKMDQKDISLIALNNLKAYHEANRALSCSSPVISNFEAFVNVMDRTFKNDLIMEIIYCVPKLCDGNIVRPPKLLVLLYKVSNQAGDRNFLHTLLGLLATISMKYWLIRDPLIRLGFSLFTHCLDVTDQNVVQVFRDPKSIHRLLYIIDQASALLPFSQFPFQNLLPPTCVDPSSPDLACVLNLASYQFVSENPKTPGESNSKFLLEIYLQNSSFDISIAHKIIKHTPRNALERIQKAMLEKLDPVIWAAVFVTNESVEAIVQQGVDQFCERLLHPQNDRLLFHSAIRLLVFHTRRCLVGQQDDTHLYFESFNNANMDTFFRNLSIPESLIDVLMPTLHSLFLHYLTTNPISMPDLTQLLSIFSNAVSSELYCIRLATAIYHGASQLLHLFFHAVLLHLANDREFLRRGFVEPDDRVAFEHSWRMCCSLKTELEEFSVQEKVLNIIAMSDTSRSVPSKEAEISIVSSLEGNRISSQYINMDSFIIPVRTLYSLPVMEHVPSREAVIPVFSEAEIETLVYLFRKQDLPPQIYRPIEFVQTRMQTLVKMQIAPGVSLSTFTLPSDPENAVDFMVSLTNQALKLIRDLEAVDLVLSEFRADTFYFHVESEMLAINSARCIRRKTSVQNPYLGEIQLLRFLLATLHKMKRHFGCPWHSHKLPFNSLFSSRLEEITERIGDRLHALQAHTLNGATTASSSSNPISHAGSSSLDKNLEHATLSVLVHADTAADHVYRTILDQSDQFVSAESELDESGPPASTESDQPDGAVVTDSECEPHFSHSTQEQAFRKAKSQDTVSDLDTIVLSSANGQSGDKTSDDNDARRFNAIFLTIAMVSVIGTIVLVLSIYKFQQQNDSIDLLF